MVVCRGYTHGCEEGLHTWLYVGVIQMGFYTRVHGGVTYMVVCRGYTHEVRGGVTHMVVCRGYIHGCM